MKRYNGNVTDHENKTLGRTMPQNIKTTVSRFASAVKMNEKIKNEQQKL